MKNKVSISVFILGIALAFAFSAGTSFAAVKNCGSIQSSSMDKLSTDKLSKKEQMAFNCIYNAVKICAPASIKINAGSGDKYETGDFSVVKKTKSGCSVEFPSYYDEIASCSVPQTVLSSKLKSTKNSSNRLIKGFQDDLQFGFAYDEKATDYLKKSNCIFKLPKAAVTEKNVIGSSDKIIQQYIAIARAIKESKNDKDLVSNVRKYESAKAGNEMESMSASATSTALLDMYQKLLPDPLNINIIKKVVIKKKAYLHIFMKDGGDQYLAVFTSENKIWKLDLVDSTVPWIK